MTWPTCIPAASRTRVHTSSTADEPCKRHLCAPAEVEGHSRDCQWPERTKRAGMRQKQIWRQTEYYASATKAHVQTPVQLGQSTMFG
jgi:hypothetical protein